MINKPNYLCTNLEAAASAEEIMETSRDFVASMIAVYAVRWEG